MSQDEAELQRLQKEDVGVREEMKGLRQKVEEAKSALSSSRSRGKVLEALMHQKKSGNIQGIYGRLVRKSFSHTLRNTHTLRQTHTHC